MADINIQHKSSNAVWWILGILALILVVWMLWGWMDTEPAVRGALPPGAPAVAAAITAAPAPAAAA